MANFEKSPVLHSLTYVSTSKSLLKMTDLENLLCESREGNIQHGITGLLLYHDNTFMQTIEGAPEDVEQLFRNISKDPRHYAVTKLIHETVEKREFPNWSMAFRHGDDGIPGFSNFMKDENPFSEYDLSLAKILLETFKRNSHFRNI